MPFYDRDFSPRSFPCHMACSHRCSLLRSWIQPTIIPLPRDLSILAPCSMIVALRHDRRLPHCLSTSAVPSMIVASAHDYSLTMWLVNVSTSFYDRGPSPQSFPCHVSCPHWHFVLQLWLQLTVVALSHGLSMSAPSLYDRGLNPRLLQPCHMVCLYLCSHLRS